MIDIDHAALPVHPNVLEMYARGETTGSNPPNRDMVKDHLRIGRSLTREHEEILFDPQTSGGLLIAVPRERAEALQKGLDSRGVETREEIGEIVSPAGEPRVTIMGE